MNPANPNCASCRHELAPAALFCPTCGTPRLREGEGDELIGKVLGERFLVQERMGHGRSGTIFRGEHVTLRRKVAIKVLHQELSRDELAIERFRREATSVAEIDNEHIVEIHDFGRTPDGRLYLAMELLEGETLDVLLARGGRLSIDQAIDVLIQTGEALVDAHSVGFIHRDLRPRNLYLAQRRGSSNFVKLLDFGLSKLVETGGAAASTSLGMTFGDPRYMSPEQAKGDPIDRRADIYSLGCIGFEMLTGEPPFSGGRVFDVLTRQVSEPARPLRTLRSEVPEWLEVAIARALAKDPAARFGTATRWVETLRTGMQRGIVLPDESPAEVGSSQPTLAPVGAAADGGSTPPTPKLGPTGTPALGIPIVSDAERPTRAAPGETAAMIDDTSWRRVSAQVEDPPLVPREPTPQANNISSVWFDAGDGVRMTDTGIRQLEAARAIRPTANPYDADDEPPVTPLLPIKTIVAVTALIAGAVVVAALSFGGSKASQSAPPPADPAAVAPVAAPPAGALAAAPAPGPSESRSTFPESVASSTVSSAPPARPPSAESATPRPARASTPPAAAVRTATSERALAPSSASARAPAAVAKEISEAGDSIIRAKPSASVAAPSPEPGEPAAAAAAPASESDAGKMAEFYAKTGEAALRSGDPVGAAGNFQKAIAADPRNADAVIGLGEVALQQGMYGDALRHLKRAVKLAPRRGRVHTLLGEAQLNSGSAAAAEQSFKRALQIDPDDERARNGYNEAVGRLPDPTDE